jgi:hypothetical protein
VRRTSFYLNQRIELRKTLRIKAINQLNADGYSSPSSLLFLSVCPVPARYKMALNNLARRMTQTSVEATSTNPIDRNLVAPEGDEKRSYDDANHVEGQGGAGRRMSRIDKKDSIDGGAYDTDSTLSIGQQMELEKDNAIKYRTCSWQKVRLNCTLVASCSTSYPN